MYFVYEEVLGRKNVIGGAVSPRGAKELASKRAKQPLNWKLNGRGFKATLKRGMVITTYTVSPEEER